jgi:hypothetical protein
VVGLLMQLEEQEGTRDKYYWQKLDHKGGVGELWMNLN